MSEIQVPGYRWRPLLEEEFDGWREAAIVQAGRPAGLFHGMHDALAVAAARLHHDLDPRPWLQASTELAHAGFMLAEGYVGEALGATFEDPVAADQHASIENWLLAWCIAALLEDGRMQAMLIDRPVRTFSRWGPTWMAPLHSYLWSVTAGDSVEPPAIELGQEDPDARFRAWPALFRQLTEGFDHHLTQNSLEAHQLFAAGRTSRPDILHTVAWVEAGVLKKLGVDVEHAYLPSTIRR